MKGKMVQLTGISNLFFTAYIVCLFIVHRVTGAKGQFLKAY